MNNLECPHCHKRISRFKAARPYRIGTMDKYAIECNHCKQLVKVENSGISDWQIGLMCGIAGFIGVIIQEEVLPECTWLVLPIAALLYCIMWLLMVYLVSGRIKITERQLYYSQKNIDKSVGKDLQ